MGKATKLNINPKILKWARDESGFSIEEIINKLDIAEIRYLNWEKNGQDIPFGKLKDIARLYKRQIATFFIPEVPQKTKKPKDYRGLDVIESELTKDTFLAIRRARKYKRLLLELNKTEYYKNKYAWLDEYIERFMGISLDSINLTKWIRDKLKYSIDSQLSDKNLETSYKSWRIAFEERLGIYIFQFPMPALEVQGFCYSDSFPFCIVVNSRYSTASKIFTLFHELGHVLKRQSGMCIPDNVSEHQLIEWASNSFAGNTLVPEKAIVPTKNHQEIFQLSRKLKVSSEVYLRRLKGLNLVTNEEFYTLLQEIRGAVRPPSKAKGFLNPLQKSINSRGQLFFNTVLDAAHKNQIPYSRATDVLGLKVNYLLSV
jgi:Zn-dependent peptidase ImmA (M78 family)